MHGYSFLHKLDPGGIAVRDHQVAWHPPIVQNFSFMTGYLLIRKIPIDNTKVTRFKRLINF